MNCAICKRRVAECACVKLPTLNGKWPQGTWFQRRIKKIRLAQVAKQAGASLVEVLCFFVVAGTVAGAGWWLLRITVRMIEQWESASRCIQALLECVNI